MDHKDWVPRFDLKNINLASLASDASIDINNYITYSNQEEKSVKYLAQLLNDITQGEKPEVILHRLNSRALAYAISGQENFKEYWEDKKIYEVALQTNLVSKDLRDFKRLSRQKQENLIDFCKNLSMEIWRSQAIFYRSHELIS